MTISKAMTLAEVVIPFARVMSDPGLSWSQREQLSRAVQFCYEHWNKMQTEQQATNSLSGQTNRPLSQAEYMYPNQKGD